MTYTFKDKYSTVRYVGYSIVFSEGKYKVGLPYNNHFEYVGTFDTKEEAVLKAFDHYESWI